MVILKSQPIDNVFHSYQSIKWEFQNICFQHKTVFFYLLKIFIPVTKDEVRHNNNKNVEIFADSKGKKQQ